MKKGFTLIELLAVIVILAIIALIATPVIINIINDAREQSAERSAELYINGLQNYIVKENLTHEFNPEYCAIKNNILTCNEEIINVQIAENTVPTNGEIQLENGKVAYYELEINGEKITSGQKLITRYYWFNYLNAPISINSSLPTGIEEDVSNIDAKGNPFYMAFNSSDGTKIDTLYVCFVRNNFEYCLEGNNPKAYERNKRIISNAFSEELNQNECLEESDSFNCTGDDLSAYVYMNGHVLVNKNSNACIINSVDNNFSCFNDL